jgi:peroxiredoxin
MAVEVGQKAPDFTLPDSNNTPQKFSDIAKDKNVVLAFFPGAFTGVCTKEACSLRDSASKLNSSNAQVIGISVDSPFAQKGWAAANNLNFPLLSDFSRKVVNQFGVALPNFAKLEGYTASQRAVFVIDKTGTVRYKQVTPSPGVEPNYDEINQAVAKLPK